MDRIKDLNDIADYLTQLEAHEFIPENLNLSFELSDAEYRDILNTLSFSVLGQQGQIKPSKGVNLTYGGYTVNIYTNE